MKRFALTSPPVPKRIRRKTPSVQNSVTPWPIFFGIRDDSFDGEECALDAAADEFNTKAREFITKEQNGLRAKWKNPWTFYNPEYWQQRLWLLKAVEEAERGISSAGLLKYAPSESYWRPNAYEKGEQHAYDGRIAFLAPKGGLWLETKDGWRYTPEGEPVKGSDFASCTVLMGPRFTSRALKYRSAKTGRLILPGHARAA